ncbi:transketolase [Candidatus Acetothermia bacterium]|nr:transketolase [Candidatus Acetothermia bacterium]MCI2427064.1 transketolase [Candidatus Acetothermia bacterium]MCI2428169.1 transketolase [Candidatus Acetothermia bacterium]
MDSITILKKKATEIRCNVLRMIHHAKSGHPGGALGMADILTVLYYRYLRHDPLRPDWEERDRFLLSNGHTCPVLYAILADQKYFPDEEIWKLRRLGGMLQGHPSTAWEVPGIEVSSGSLGNGLSVAVGMAMAAKLDQKGYRVFCQISDAECQAGQTWEAATAAVHYRLDNLCIFLDWNQCQIDGHTEEVMDVGDIAAKWAAFGWRVHEIDGHNYDEIIAAFDSFAQTAGSNKPTLFAAHTILGKGVSFMEDDPNWHHGAPNDAQLKEALASLLVVS